MNYRKYNWNFDLIQTPLPTLTERLEAARKDCERVARGIYKPNKELLYWEFKGGFICKKCGYQTKALSRIHTHPC